MSGPTNADIAAALASHAALLELSGEGPFRVRAYRTAAASVRSWPEPMDQVASDERLREIPGVGEAIAAAIADLVTTGRHAPFEALASEIPPSLAAVMALPGVGAKTVMKLHRELGITDIATLEQAALAGRIRNAAGLGAKVEATILSGLEALKGRSGRMPIGLALPAARTLADALRTGLPGSRVEIAGSIRRFAETAADIDAVVESSDSAATLEAIAALPLVSSLISQGYDACRVRLQNGIEADLFLASPSTFGAVLVRATGPASHVERLGPLPAEAHDEAAVYAAAGIPFIPPELRSGGQEFDRADEIPGLITIADMRGELHCHTTWSDGSASIAGMAGAARDRGYRFLGITDHSVGLGIANGLSPERLLAQRDEIRAHVGAPLLLAGSEVEVGRDGSLDFDDAILAGLDVVVASLHTGLRRPREELMGRVERVLRNPHVDIVAHPSGRLVERRQPGDFDWARYFALAAETATALEINADPARLDLKADHAEMAIAAGCLLTINCDAHHPDGFGNIEYGVAVARQAWATPDRVINTWDPERLADWLANRR
jgi:DNA polymerase (family X)